MADRPPAVSETPVLSQEALDNAQSLADAPLDMDHAPFYRYALQDVLKALAETPYGFTLHADEADGPMLPPYPDAPQPPAPLTRERAEAMLREVLPAGNWIASMSCDELVARLLTALFPTGREPVDVTDVRR